MNMMKLLQQKLSKQIDIQTKICTYPFLSYYPFVGSGFSLLINLQDTKKN